MRGAKNGQMKSSVRCCFHDGFDVVSWDGRRAGGGHLALLSASSIEKKIEPRVESIPYP